jgi:surface antigen
VILANVSHLPETVDKPIAIQRAYKDRSATGRVILVEQRRVGSGQCVAFVQAAGFDIHAGAARNWVAAATNAGYTVSSVPIKGAAVVTWESSAGSKSGHVALVEEVDDNFIYVVEQNYVAGRVSHGKIARTSATIRAYIYPLS